jgi:2-isopropylmalate synthase
VIPASVLPGGLSEIVQHSGDHVGIHTHNDTEQAVADTFAAVDAGARQIRGR